MHIEIISDCECEHIKHEIKNYPREGLVAKHFRAGERFTVEKKWRNMIGHYYRIKTPKGTADIAVHNAKEITYLKR